MENQGIVHQCYKNIQIMKILKNTFFAFVLMGIAITSHAQDTKKDKKAAKEAAFKKVLDDRNFTFTAQSAQPLRGGDINVTPEFDLRIVQDSVIAYLPYFGRAYVAPIDPTEGGIKFTSTKFAYTSEVKKSGYEIVIKPVDAKDVRMLVLDVTSGGYATLSVTNSNRDPIRFNGYVEGNKKEKKDN